MRTDVQAHNTTKEGMPSNVVPIEGLLREHEYAEPPYDVWKVEFHDLPEGLTAYNSSDVFLVDNGETEIPHILARKEVKGADGEFTSQVSIFRCSPDGRDCWPADNISNLQELVKGKITQDPSIARFNGNWVITWVEVTPIDMNDPSQGSDFKSVTCIGKTLDTLHHLVDSSDGTKGLRYVGLLDRRVGITTRVFIDGVGKTCFTIANSLEEVTTETLDSARVIEGASPDIGWGGPNQLQLLANGDIFLLSHAARFNTETNETGEEITVREYDVTSSVITLEPDNNPDNPAGANDFRIIATERDFNLDIDPKRPDLIRVAYPGFILIRQDGGPATLFVALRDSGEAGALIKDPLEKWRAEHPEFAKCPLYYPRTEFGDFRLAA